MQAPVRVPLLLFAFGLLLRILFCAAGPDGGPGWHIGFQGDVPIWRDQAARLAAGLPDAELRLPWRAPGMMWFVASLWDGRGEVWPLRLLCLVLGAGVAPLVWLLLRESVPARVAVLAAGACAASSNLLLLSSSLHFGDLYLVLSLWALCQQARLPTARGPWLPLRWGALHGVLCLLRTENVICLVLLLVVGKCLGVRWRSLLLGAAAAGLVLLPWQLHAARLVHAFNAVGPPEPTLQLPWDADALAAVRALPPFSRRAVFELVDATVRWRGGSRVAVADLAIVEEAYGAGPEPLPVPLIALNGPFNFFLANSREATAGHTRRALDRDPPLAGGAQRYPAWLRVPRGEHRRFSLGYPPHLAVAVHGYALGFAEIAAEPWAACLRVVDKLVHAAGGATGGLGGYALPIGLSGVRREVDMVTADGAFALLWRLFVLVVAAAGLWRLRGNRGLWPLLAFTAANVAVVVLFFGHARQGAHCLPVVALGVAAVAAGPIGRWPAARAVRIGLLALAALLVLEGVRAATVTATVDGALVLDREPFPEDEYRTRRVEFR